MTSNLETVREIIDALNRGDVDGVVAPMDPDFEWRPLEDSPVAGSYRGHEQVRGYVEDWLNTFDLLRIDVEELSEDGDRVVAMVRSHGRAKQSGIEIHDRFCQEWTVRGGVAVQMRERR